MVGPDLKMNYQDTDSRYQLDETVRGHFQYRAVNGGAGLATELSPGKTSLQRSVDAFQKRTSKEGRLIAMCICAYLSLQLDQPASALCHASDILGVSFAMVAYVWLCKQTCPKKLANWEWLSWTIVRYSSRQSISMSSADC